MLILALLAALFWFLLLVFWHDFWRIGTGLREKGKSHPEIGIIIPARNEEQSLPRTLPGLLAQNYPGKFSVLVIDDQSEDQTAQIAVQLGAQVINGKPRPPGWSGKLWAMRQGVAALPQSVEYILFTDADIAYEPYVLKKLVATAEDKRLVQVSVMAQLNCQSLWEKLLIPAFIFFFQKLYPFRAVNDPASKIAGAAGGCLLARKDALLAIGNLDVIKGEIIDDCALAKRLKTQGPIWLGFDKGVRSLRAYNSLGEIWQMVARTAFVQLKESYILLLLSIVGMAFLYLLPLWAFLSKDVFGLLGLILMFIAYGPTIRLYGLNWGWVLSLPLAGLLYSLMTLSSGLNTLSGRGNLWKGRKNPAWEIKEANDEALRVVKAAKTSFYWAMRTLPKPKRDAMFAIYAFCREVDDIADEGGDDRLERLQDWREEIARVYTGYPQTKIGLALREAKDHFGLLAEDMLAVVEGMEMDAVPIVAPAWEKLDHYCDCVASAVGRLSNRVFGAPSEHSWDIAHHLGRALQLTNILRDIKEDAERGRLYLPANLLARHEIELGDLDAVLRHPRLPLVCAELGETALQHFKEAERLLALCDAKIMRPAIMMKAAYKPVLLRMQAQGWAYPFMPIKLSKWEKVRLIVQA